MRKRDQRGHRNLWLGNWPFFGDWQREQMWFFWRRYHHRTQVQAWLRLAGHEPVRRATGRPATETGRG